MNCLSMFSNITNKYVLVCLNIMDKQSEKTKDTKWSYKDGNKNKFFQSGGVKKLIILAIVKDTKENYDNVSKIIKKLGLDNVDYYAVFDFKLANIFFGIESCSSSHPCVYCEATSEEVKHLTNGHCRRYVKILSIYFSYVALMIFSIEKV